MDNTYSLDNIFEKYQLIFENSPLGICVTQIDGQVSLNNTFCEMLGYNNNELLEAGWKDITYKDDIAKHHEIFDLYSTKDNDIKKIEKRFLKKDGTVIWTEVTSRLKNDENGKPAFLVSMIRDISEYKKIQDKLKQNEIRYKQLFDNNPSPMFLYDIKTLKFLLVNNAAILHYGYSEDEFLKMTIKDIRPAEDIPKLMDNINKIDSTISESDTWRHVKKDGSIILVKMSAYSIQFNGYTGRVINIVDITEKVAAKQELVIEVAKLKSIIESTSDAIFSLDTNYCYTSFNSTHAVIMKKLYAADIKVGNSLLDYMNVEADRLKAKINIDRALKGERINETSISGDELLSQKYFEILHNPIKDDSGDVIGVSVFAKDITDQKIAFNKVKQLSMAVEQSPVTIIITDTEGNIQYVNKKGLELTGYNMEELINNNPRILSSGERTKLEYRVLWNTIKAGEEWKGEFHNKKKNGDFYWELAAISPIKNENNEITNFLAVKEDITERKKNEQELIEAKEKAEEINKIKSVFFSNMSHELRTPLVGIIGFADILSSSLDDEDFKNMSISILKGGKRLLATLTSLMNLSELETLKTNIDIMDFDANIICTDLVNHFKVNNVNPNIEIKTEYNSDSLDIKINSNLFRESINQLLNNAITYTEKGSVTLKTYKKNMPDSDTGIGIIEISDTGIGIPLERQKIVFEEFRQASEGFGRHFEGTGLGLTISKKYVELMGGTIELISEVGKGTKIILSFPASLALQVTEVIEKGQLNPSNGNSKSIKGATSQNKEKRILIVEDDEINTIFLEKCFSKGFSYKSVQSGPSAIQLASDDKFDLILMDINLKGGMDGITATQIIRKISGYEKIPILAMTAYTAPEEIEEFLAKGCSHYISKPFLMNELLTLVNQIFIDELVEVNI